MRQIIFLLIILVFKLINCESDTIEKEATSECDENVLTNYLAEIEVTSPETLVEQTVTNYESFCRRIYEQLEKFHKYLKTCKVTDEEGLYMSLLNGVKALHKKLCITSEFTRRFQLYYPCLHELRKDLDGCDGPVDWYEDKDDTEVCKSYKHIVDCYYIKTAKVCGIDGAKTLKELTRDVVESIIKTKCSEIKQDPEVKDPMPDSYLCGKAESGHNSFEVITLFTFLRLYLI